MKKVDTFLNDICAYATETDELKLVDYRIVKENVLQVDYMKHILSTKKITIQVMVTQPIDDFHIEVLLIVNGELYDYKDYNVDKHDITSGSSEGRVCGTIARFIHSAATAA